MSEISATDIRTTLGEFDAFVRVAVEQGNLDSVSGKEGQIKKFYKLCKRFTDQERVAAFNAKIFLHSFLRDYRLDRTSPTFLDDQRRRLRKFDTKNLSASWALQADPIIAAAETTGRTPALIEEAIPAATTIHSDVSATATQAIPAAKTGNKDRSATAPHPAHSSTPDPAYRSNAPAYIPVTQAIPAAKTVSTMLPATAAHPTQRSMPTSTSNAFKSPITSGPGPSTLAHKAAAKSSSVHPPARFPSSDFDLLQRIDEEDVTWKSFKEIDEDVDMDDFEFQPRPQTKIDAKGKDAKGNDRKGNDPKGKRKAVDSSDDEFKVIHSRPRKSIPQAPAKEDDPSMCSKCRIMGKRCERQPSGGACVSCRRFKHKCEFARQRKQAKSKARVESEDESSSKTQVESEDESSTAPEGRHPRLAAKLARRAIRKVVAPSPAIPKSRVKRNSTSGNTKASLPDFAALEPRIMEKLDIIVDHLAEMSKTLKLILTDGDSHLSTPASRRRLSPLALGSPATAGTSDFDMNSPSPSLPKPNINLIEPTPDNSQKAHQAISQLYPSPRHPLPLSATAVSSSPPQMEDISSNNAVAPSSIAVSSLPPSMEVISSNNAAVPSAPSNSSNALPKTQTAATVSLPPDLISGNSPPISTSSIQVPSSTPVDTADGDPAAPTLIPALDGSPPALVNMTVVVAPQSVTTTVIPSTTSVNNADGDPAAPPLTPVLDGSPPALENMTVIVAPQPHTTTVIPSSTSGDPAAPALTPVMDGSPQPLENTTIIVAPQPSTTTVIPSSTSVDTADSDPAASTLTPMLDRSPPGLENTTVIVASTPLIPHSPKILSTTGTVSSTLGPATRTRSRSRTPQPYSPSAGRNRASSKASLPSGQDSLGIPNPLPHSRSGTRSRSSSPLPGEKRKASKDWEAEDGKKKMKR